MDSPPHRASPTAWQGGFTTIELVTTLLVVAIIAVAVVPRLNDRSVFEARGFQDETLALLRYAQKAAIAQHRYVCVAFTAASASLSFGATSACGTSLTGPDGKAPFAVTAGATTGYVSAPAGFYFEPSGRPSAGRSIAVVGAGTVTVEAETGYVR